NGCILSSNQSVGGGGPSGGSGFGSGVFNIGPTSAPYAGTPATISLLSSTITGNLAIGGSPGGLGIGGGAYLAPGGVACADAATSIAGSTASTSDPDVYGGLTACP